MKKFLKCYDAVLHKDDFYLDETVETLTKNSKLYSLILKADNDIDQISLGFSDDPRVNLDDCFILVPSAVYDGNRFECIHIPYPPSIPQGKRLLEEKIIANDIPRLLNDGDNLFEHRLGSGASPIVALWDKHNCKGIIYAYSPLSNGTPFTESGFYITNKGEFNFCYPVVRKRRYNFSLGWEIGGDRYANIKNGETINFQVKKSEFACGSIEEFYDMVLQNRYAWGRKTEQKGLPLNEAFNTIKNKFNIHNWYEESGLYRTYPYEEFRTFSSGWCGGGFIPYIYRKLFEDTDSLNIERAHRFMNYIYPNTQAPSGLFYSQINEKGEITGDDFIDPSITSTHLIRRSADILFYHTSLFLYMQKQKKSIPNNWHTGLKSCADAFVSLWYNNKDLGFWVNNETLDIVISGSHSGAIAIAGLALASVYFQNSLYLDTSKEIAKKLYKDFISLGFTTGGPAEAMKAPDSESAYALLEGLLTLYEITKDETYLNNAEHTAAYVSTWINDYDYPYPNTSFFGKTNKKTTGTVWANLQNKHAAPGICTHSGSAFLRLYLYTNKQIYLDILSDVARAITQFTAHPDNKLFDYEGTELPYGYMCERVNTSDWEDYMLIGSLFNGSNWCEYSLMMTYTDIPSIVWNKLSNTVTTLDRIEATIKDDKLRLYNPTKYDCRINLLICNGEKEICGMEISNKFTNIFIKSNETLIL